MGQHGDTEIRGPRARSLGCSRVSRTEGRGLGHGGVGTLLGCHPREDRIMARELPPPQPLPPAQLHFLRRV